MEQSQEHPTSWKPTDLVRYGALWSPRLEQLSQTGDGAVAVLVCHGMGQQVRYETISSIASAIQTAALEDGGRAEEITVHLSQANDDFLARAELRWTDQQAASHEVHVYEAYWAPVTEGKVTYWDTIKFLLRAAYNGLRYSLFGGTFQRWMFDGRKTLGIDSFTSLALAAVLLVLGAQVGIIGYVSLRLAQQYKAILSQPLPANHLLSWFQWILPLFPGSTVMWHQPICDRLWWAAAGHLLLWLVLIAEAYYVRYFIIEYVGDVAAYISPYKDSKFDDIRHRIQTIGLNVGKVIYGFDTSATVPNYNRVVMVGHSLGSVLAYDTLNALINQDSIDASGKQHDVVKRTRALVTFGSPLDKTAFIFRTQARNDRQWIREQLAASMQPLIVSYPQYRPNNSFRWVNIWSRMDVISGSLEYYDDPTPDAALNPVINLTDPDARIPFAAHLQYWDNKTLRDQLYKYVA